ncbi:MAG: alcohol dehydrogenase catalytic domain-containing protein [candidate division NC10 bacterium]
MKAAILEETGRIEVRDVEDLRPARDEVLIRTACAGVCGSDLHAFRGRHPFRKPPVVLGHELAGTVVEVGHDVGDIRLDDRVTMMPLVSCGRCRLCRMGRENICLDKRVPGVGGWLGSFAEYSLAKASVTFRLGEATAFELGVLAEPLAVGVHAVMRQARLEAGSRVLVLGGGTIGILTALTARAAGAGDIVITDLLAFNLAPTQALCGAATVHVGREGWEADLARTYPEKFDVTFLCSGDPATVGQAVRLTRRAGRIVVTGLFLEPVPMDLTAVTLGELEVVGSQIYDHRDFRTAVDWIDDGRFDFRKLVTHTFPLAGAQAALTLLSDRTEDAVKILLQM